MKMFKFEKREKEPGLISESDLKQTSYKIVYSLMVLIMILMVVIAVVPAIWAFVTGFKDSQEIYQIPATFFPKEFRLSRISEAWVDLSIGSNILSTFALSFCEVAAMLIVCGLGGYVISKLKPKGIKMVFVLVVWTMMMPATVRLVPLYMSFVDFPIGHINMLNSFWPLIMIAAANAFNMVLFKNFFDTVSNSLVEAARLDGCNDLRILFRIMLPLSMPAVAYTSIMTFNGTWSDFLMPMLVLSDRKLQPLPVVIFNILNTTNVKINNYMMALFLACVPPLVVFTLFQRQIMGGLNIGGVKG